MENFIKVGDHVAVNFNAALMTLSKRAVVVHMPQAPGDSWVFRDVGSGQIHYVSEFEGYTISKLEQEESKHGRYRVIDQTKVMVSNAAFTVRKGKVIEVRQWDTARKQVLIDFGGGYIDWFHESWLKNHAEPLRDEEVTE